MKKFTSLLLALVMCMSLCVPAFAVENNNDDGFVPGLGTICSIIDFYLDYEEALKNDALDGHVMTDYYKYTYTNSNNYSWYHIVWYYRSEEDGLARYLTCEVHPDI